MLPIRDGEMRRDAPAGVRRMLVQILVHEPCGAEDNDERARAAIRLHGADPLYTAHPNRRTRARRGLLVQRPDASRT
jgi:hypothetical protein